MLRRSTRSSATSPLSIGRKSTTSAFIVAATFAPLPYNTVMLTSGPCSAVSPSTLAFLRSHCTAPTGFSASGESGNCFRVAPRSP